MHLVTAVANDFTLPPLTTHVAEEGDTWASIAQEYDTNVETLRIYNESVTVVIEGVTVQVPVLAPTPRPTASLAPSATPTTSPTPPPLPTPMFAYQNPVAILPTSGTTHNWWEGKSPMLLVWTSAGILEENDYYVVHVRAITADNTLIYNQYVWTRDPSLRLGDTEFSDIAERSTIYWDVIVMSETTLAGAERRTGEVVSNRSNEMQFNFMPLDAGEPTATPPTSRSN